MILEPVNGEWSASGIRSQSIAHAGLARQLRAMTPIARWKLLALALMGPRPTLFLEALRVNGCLQSLLPELDALFGVPHGCSDIDPVDTGMHQLRLLARLSRDGEPLEVRFAALMHKIGRAGAAGAPPVQARRGRALLDGLAARIAVPPQALELARLVIDEADSVQRACALRAGALADLLDRTRALRPRDQFDRLLRICSADHAAFPGHANAGCPKVGLVRRAAAIWDTACVDGMAAEAARHARAEAISQALCAVTFASRERATSTTA